MSAGWGTPFPAYSKRIVNRRTLMREKLRTVLSDVKTVFQANSKLAVDHDRWFVAKAHAGLNRRLVATHKVSPLVTVEADAVTGAMRQARRLVIGTKAGFAEHFPRRIIHCFARRANSRGGEARVLRLALDFPNVALPLRWFAKDEGACDV